jgi:hypothetical protein
MNEIGLETQEAYSEGRFSKRNFIIIRFFF